MSTYKRGHHKSTICDSHKDSIYGLYKSMKLIRGFKTSSHSENIDYKYN